MSAWSHLPNSHHIDWVIESVKQNPQVWAKVVAAWVAWEAVAVAKQAAWVVAESRNVARHAAGVAACWAPDEANVTDEAWNAAQSAVFALVAYDDCDQYLNMSYEKLHVYAILSEKPQAILLLPMVYVKEKLNEHALV